MEHPNILSGHDVNQLARFHVSDLYEAWLEGQYVRVRECKSLWLSLPRDLPIRPRPPSIAIAKEGEIAVVQQKFAVQPLDVYGLDILLASYEIERGISLI